MYREKQVIPLMIPNGEGILRGISSKHHGDIYCLICLHSLPTENKPGSHNKEFKNKIFCNIVVPSEDTKMLEFNQHQKSDKIPFIIYAGLQYLIEKIDG